MENLSVEIFEKNKIREQYQKKLILELAGILAERMEKGLLGGTGSAPVDRKLRRLLQDCSTLIQEHWNETSDT